MTDPLGARKGPRGFFNARKKTPRSCLVSVPVLWDAAGEESHKTHTLAHRIPRVRSFRTFCRRRCVRDQSFEVEENPCRMRRTAIEACWWWGAG